MRLEKLPFVVVLLVGRVKPFKSIKSLVGEWDFGWMEFFEERELRDNQVMWLVYLVGKFDFENKAVASCATRRIKRTPSWRSQNERPVKTGARVVLLGHTRHY